MEQNKLQQNYRDVEERRFDEFIRAFNDTYEPRLVKPANDGSHVRVYHYGEGKNKFNICYDCVADTVQTTAGATMLDIIRMYLERYGCIADSETVVSEKASPIRAATLKEDSAGAGGSAGSHAHSETAAEKSSTVKSKDVVEVRALERIDTPKEASLAASSQSALSAKDDRTVRGLTAAPAKAKKTETTVGKNENAQGKRQTGSEAPSRDRDGAKSTRGSKSAKPVSKSSAIGASEKGGAKQPASVAKGDVRPTASDRLSAANGVSGAQPAAKRDSAKRAAADVDSVAAPRTNPGADGAETERAYKDGYSLAKYEEERFERGVRELEGHASVAKVQREETNAGGAQHTVRVAVLGKDKSKMTVQYAVRRKVMQIQGKPGPLADLVQNVFSEEASEKAIIQARVEFNKAREKKPKEKAQDAARTPSALQKSLNKALPNGIKYLSKQSQTYLYYALIDLESNLSNYGGILATAYQGLENLISNLQRSEGIKVKLIGQAYEKENGRYTLKSSYRRRIKSVVYNEVMSALYTEYFDKRHFYTHSDNFSDTARIIQDQAEAKAEFARLITVIEYNATKLSEIGFTVDNAAMLATK